MNNELYHFGIKGMKWGVRRYQNSDGSLTDEGRKRYYTTEGRLNRHGIGYNKQASDKLNRYKDATYYNASHVYRQFDSTLKRFKDLKKVDHEFARDALDQWLSGQDYKNLDYEQFKDERHRRFYSSEPGKQLEKTRKQLANMLDETAKGHPLYDKSFKKLRDVSPTVYHKYANIPLKDAVSDFETVQYGKAVVSQLMVEIEYLDKYPTK